MLRNVIVVASPFHAIVRSPLPASRRPPELDLVAFWINDPAKLPVFRVVKLVHYIAALFPERFEERAGVGYSVVHHNSLSESDVA
jgi:hypothetical protein